MYIQQLDVETAYLNGDSDEDIFMESPTNFSEILNDLIKNETGDIKNTAPKMLKDFKNGRTTLILKKALYGLKQSGRQRYKKLDKKLKELDMSRTNNDPCIYIKRNDKNILITIVYVYDLIVMGSDINEINNLKKHLSNDFKMKDMGNINYFLGVIIIKVKIF